VSYETVTRIIEEIGDHARALKGADLADKAELYRKLDLELTYKPQNQTLQVEARLHPARVVGPLSGRFGAPQVRVG
jgi:hypothetical protein